MHLDMRAKVEAALPNVELVDIARGCMAMRMVKSDAEIELIRHGARIADIGGAACVEAIGEGVPEYEVALHSTQAMVREIGRSFPHGELMDTWTWFQSGINTDGAHNPVTARKIRKGDILSLNCFPDDRRVLHRARAHGLLRGGLEDVTNRPASFGQH